MQTQPSNMQTDQALNILEALIVLTGDPKLSLAQACGILRNVKSAIELQPTSDAKSQLNPQRTNDAKDAQQWRDLQARARKVVAEHDSAKSRFLPTAKKKLGRPRKVAQK